MDLSKFQPFIKQAMESGNPLLAQQATSLNDSLMRQYEDESVASPDAEKELQPGEQKKDDVDQLMQGAMQDIVQLDEENESDFGKGENGEKTASAYIADRQVSEVPAKTKSDLQKFLNPKQSKEVKVIQYGMVVKELLPKVDPHNFAQAELHIKKDYEGKATKKLKDEFFEQSKDKYILILNDHVVDGHHFLAKAKYLGITSSLMVLDLTPLRFQEKTAAVKPKSKSIWSALQNKYGKNYNRRQATTKK